MYVTIGGQDPNKLSNASGKAFIAAFKKAYHVKQLEAYTGYGAQAFLVLANAIQKSNGSRGRREVPVQPELPEWHHRLVQDRLHGRPVARRCHGRPDHDRHDHAARGDPAAGLAGGQGARLATGSEPKNDGNERGDGANDGRARPRARSPSAGADRERDRYRAPRRRRRLGENINAIKDWQQFTIVFLNGLTNGSIYALVAIGYTLVYGILELINFAHGDVFTLGRDGRPTPSPSAGSASTARRAASRCFASLLLALFCAAAFCATLNMGVERVAYRRLRNAPRLAPLITAIGMSFVLSNAVAVFYGFNYVEHEPAAPARRRLPHRPPGLRLGQADRARHHVPGADRLTVSSSARGGARRCGRRRRTATRPG